MSSASNLHYGSRIILFRQSTNGYVISTSSAESPVGLQTYDPLHPSVPFEYCVFVLRPADAVEVSTNSEEGMLVKYGQVVTLQHQIHQLPLSCHQENHAVVLKGNLKVQLDAAGGNTKLTDRWRIMPRYKLRVEGEPVVDGDAVLLQSIDGEHFLNVAEHYDEEAGGSEQMTYEVSCGTQLQGFQLSLYDGDVGPLYKPSTLRCGDCITLYHTEELKFLQLDPASGACVLKDASAEIGNSSADADVLNVTEGETDRDLSRRLCPNNEVTHLSLFIVEAADARRGGAISRNPRDLYRLKSFSSGLYLVTGSEKVANKKSAGAPAVDEGEKPDTEMDNAAVVNSILSGNTPQSGATQNEHAVISYTVALTDDRYNNGTLFRFVTASTSVGSESLCSGHHIFLECPLSDCGRLWIVGGKPVDGGADSLNTVGSLVNGKRTRGTTSLLGSVTKSLRDAIEVRRLNSKALEEVSRVRSFLPPLERFTTNASSGVFDSFNLREVNESLLHLRSLLRVETPDEQTGRRAFHTASAAMVDPLWQRKLFNQGVPAAVFRVIKSVMKCPQVKQDRLFTVDLVGATEASPKSPTTPTTAVKKAQLRHVELGELVDFCFEFLCELLENRPFYVQSFSEHVDFIMECSAYVSSAFSCLYVFFNNNPSFVELPSAQHRLTFFLKLIQNGKCSPPILGILRLFARCGDETLVEGQRQLLDFFAQDMRFTKEIFLPILLTKPDLFLERSEFSPYGDASTNAAKDEDTLYWEEKFQKNEPLMMVAVRNDIFTPSSDVGSVVSAQYVRHDNLLHQLMMSALNTSAAKKTTNIPIESLQTLSDDFLEIRDYLIPYLTEQIRLFSALCSNRNTQAMERVVGSFVSSGALQLLLSSDRLPPQLHGALIDLLAYTCVAFPGSLRLSEDIRTLYFVPSDSHRSVTFSPENVPVTLQSAKSFCVEYFAATSLSVSEECIHRNMAVLHLIMELLNAGVFNASDSVVLLNALITPLNRCAENTPTDVVESRSVYNSILRIMILVNFVVDVNLAQFVMQLVSCFRSEQGVRHIAQLMSLCDPEEGTSVGEGEERKKRRCCSCIPCCRKGTAEVRQAAGTSNSPTGVYGLTCQLLEVLIKVSSRTQSSTVRNASIFLFFRLTDFVKEVIALSQNVQVLSSARSLSYFKEINHFATTLTGLLSRSFKRGNTISLVNSTVKKLHEYIKRDGGESPEEMLEVVRRAGIPNSLVAVLSKIYVPLKPASSELVGACLQLITLLCKDADTLQIFREKSVTFSPLISVHPEVLDILRTVYLEPTLSEGTATIPTVIYSELVKCLLLESRRENTFAFLFDLLTKPDSSVGTIGVRQQAVWRALVSNLSSARLIQFRLTWCGENGSTLRELVLSGPECYKANGALDLHLQLMRLLHLISNDCQLLKPEEIRREVFGVSPVDAILQICSEAVLPVFFRSPYVSLLTTLFAQDVTVLPSVCSHRYFTSFVRMCTLDVARLIQLDGGQLYSASLEEELGRREEFVYSCPPSTEAEKKMDAERFGLKAHTTMAMYCLASVGCILKNFKLISSQINKRVYSLDQVALNEFVDVSFDLVSFYFTADGSGSCRADHWERSDIQVVQQYVQLCIDTRFLGLGRWSNDRATGALRESVLNVEERRSAQQNSKTGYPQKEALGEVASEVREYTDDEKVILTDASASSEWERFIKTNLGEAPANMDEHLFSSAVGLLFRNADNGYYFVQTLLCALPVMNVEFTTKTLHLVRQLVLLPPNSPHDYSEDTPITCKASEHVFLTADTPDSVRQTVLSRWKGDARLDIPIPLIALVGELLGSEFKAVRMAALSAAITLAMNGHRGMQESFMNYCRACANEQIFYNLRNHMIAFQDDLKQIGKGSHTGRGAADVSYMFSDMEEITQELRFLQLLCYGQFTPVQTYLVAQPDNNISVNLVESMVELVSFATKAASEKTTPFFIQLFSTIKETLQGPCQINQDTFVAYNVADYLSQILADGDVPNPRAVYFSVEETIPPKRKPKTDSAQPSKQECQDMMKEGAVSTLLALLEGRQEPSYVAQVVSTTDLSVLVHTMDRSSRIYVHRHGRIVRPTSKGLSSGDFVGPFRTVAQYFRDFFKRDLPTGSEELEDELSLAVDLYTFFRMCHDMELLAASRNAESNGTKEQEEFVDRRGKTIKGVLRKSPYYTELETKIGKVEIVRNGFLERVYFRLLSSSREGPHTRDKGQDYQ
ncbi:Inositol 1,4,5-trisphosphate/ryanodine receptor/RyR and IP3R Homology associated, putative [Angomonas deanei]|uniref:Inositol 1,4,5-trisphosphate/ryanodine receptor/RyR and IP3R Homology associated, putative n=1 Tax=Angomonas deanei TaxID=59799 RepID=A0A7G2C430_9TRYP|nr:Inositol 1,4,5-trisphosphate/ryanodine receptor/RyR and IP3R Homology associated, putative [Angomonas deanei]